MIKRRLSVALILTGMLLGATSSAASSSENSVESCTSEAEAAPYLRSESQASLYRLYCAMFQRTPDSAGNEYWARQHANGMRIIDIAELFTMSAEVSQRYGNLSRNDFLIQVYFNVLGRSFDQAGFDYWLAELDSGRVGRGYLLLLFSESEEFVERTYSTYTPPPTPAVPAQPQNTNNVQTSNQATVYTNCAEARNAGATPVRRGDPGYGNHLDRDSDGIGCE